MDKNKLKDFVQHGINLNAEYVDAFYEEKTSKNYVLIDQKIDKVTYKQEKGIGIRLNDGEKTYYTCLNELEDDAVVEAINSMKGNFKSSDRPKKIVFQPEQVHELEAKIPHDKYSIQKKKEYLKKIDSILRKMDKRINQVVATLV